MNLSPLPLRSPAGPAIAERVLENRYPLRSTSLTAPRAALVVKAA